MTERALFATCCDAGLDRRHHERGRRNPSAGSTHVRR